MKHYHKLLALVALAISLGSVFAQAETAGTSAPSATVPAAGPNASSPASAAAPAAKSTDTSKKKRTRLDMLSEKLSLTEAQKERIALIMKDQRAAEKQLKKDISVPEDLKRARRREIADTHETQIREVLTQEQRTAFDQLTTKEHARSRM